MDSDTNSLTGPAMLIDQYLPEFDFNEIHTVAVKAEARSVYPLVRHLDFSESWITRILFKLRGLAADDLTLDAMLNSEHFSILEDVPATEMVIGGLGDSKPNPIPIVDCNHFVNFNDNKGVKIAWNFSLSEMDSQQTRVATETRVQCLGKGIRRKFSVYWFFVRPFSGLIRREMLRILKKQAETSVY
ncbi:MAG: hypothetical protein ACE5IY_21145 [bacterium]